MDVGKLVVYIQVIMVQKNSTRERAENTKDDERPIWWFMYSYGIKRKKVRKLETVGLIHSGMLCVIYFLFVGLFQLILLNSLGLSVLLLRLDSPAGYIGRISRSKMLTIPSTVNEFGKGVLPVIVLAWKAKVCITSKYN